MYHLWALCLGDRRPALALQSLGLPTTRVPLPLTSYLHNHLISLQHLGFLLTDGCYVDCRILQILSSAVFSAAV